MPFSHWETAAWVTEMAAATSVRVSPRCVRSRRSSSPVIPVVLVSRCYNVTVPGSRAYAAGFVLSFAPVNAYTAGLSRLMFALGRRRQLPAWLGVASESGTPLRALGVLGGICVVAAARFPPPTTPVRGDYVARCVRGRAVLRRHAPGMDRCHHRVLAWVPVTRGPICASGMKP